MALITDECIETLIEEIEKRPPLYQKNLKEYSDINIKKSLWLEVCQAVVPGWSEFDTQEKIKQGNDVQKRWNNLRTCFRREINVQKNIKLGLAVSKRRKYIYFDKMLFLLPCIDNSATEGKIEPPNSPNDDHDYYLEGATFYRPPTCTPTQHPRRKRKNTAEHHTSLDYGDKALLEALKETRDEDTNFALSLVPSFQALTPEEKLDAKINILNIFKEILAERRRQTTLS